MSKDRPLTDAQERALIALDRNYDLWVERGRPRTEQYTLPPRVTVATLDVLKRLGLVETQWRPYATVAQITEQGRELLAGMGD